MSLTKGEAVDLPTPTRSGYHFAGWYYGEGANRGQVTAVTPITKDMELVAEWKAAWQGELGLQRLSLNGRNIEFDRDTMESTYEITRNDFNGNLEISMPEDGKLTILADGVPVNINNLELRSSSTYYADFECEAFESIEFKIETPYDGNYTYKLNLTPYSGGFSVQSMRLNWSEPLENGAEIAMSFVGSLYVEIDLEAPNDVYFSNLTINGDSIGQEKDQVNYDFGYMDTGFWIRIWNLDSCSAQDSLEVQITFVSDYMQKISEDWTVDATFTLKNIDKVEHPYLLSANSPFEPFYEGDAADMNVEILDSSLFDEEGVEILHLPTISNLQVGTEKFTLQNEPEVGSELFFKSDSSDNSVSLHVWSMGYQNRVSLNIFYNSLSAWQPVGEIKLSFTYQQYSESGDGKTLPVEISWDVLEQSLFPEIDRDEIRLGNTCNGNWLFAHGSNVTFVVEDVELTEEVSGHEFAWGTANLIFSDKSENGEYAEWNISVKADAEVENITFYFKATKNGAEQQSDPITLKVLPANVLDRYFDIPDLHFGESGTCTFDIPLDGEFEIFTKQDKGPEFLSNGENSFEWGTVTMTVTPDTAVRHIELVFQTKSELDDHTWSIEFFLRYTHTDANKTVDERSFDLRIDFPPVLPAEKDVDRLLTKGESKTVTFELDGVQSIEEVAIDYMQQLNEGENPFEWGTVNYTLKEEGEKYTLTFEFNVTQKHAFTLWIRIYTQTGSEECSYAFNAIDPEIDLPDIRATLKMEQHVLQGFKFEGESETIVNAWLAQAESALGNEQMTYTQLKELADQYFDMLSDLKITTTAAELQAARDAFMEKYTESGFSAKAMEIFGLLKLDQLSEQMTNFVGEIYSVFYSYGGNYEQTGAYTAMTAPLEEMMPQVPEEYQNSTILQFGLAFYYVEYFFENYAPTAEELYNGLKELVDFYTPMVQEMPAYKELLKTFNEAHEAYQASEKDPDLFAAAVAAMDAIWSYYFDNPISV